MNTVGVLGLGIMGSAISAHLVDSGFTVVGFDPIATQRAKLTSAGGTPLESAGQVAAAARTIITSLPSVEAVETVTAELAAHCRPGSIVLETSTLPISVKEELRSRLTRAAVIVLDSPLSGTGAQAITREIVVFGSGDQDAFESLRPVCEAFARSVRYLGPFGHGSIMKFVANLLVAVHNVSTAEAFALAARAGLDRQLMYDAVREGAGGSVIFDKRGKLMIDEQYLPATAKVSLFVKDVGIVRDYARALDLPTPLLDRTVELYDRAMAAGYADLDAAALLSLMKSDHLGDVRGPGDPKPRS